MYTIERTYTDFLGNERTEEFRFNLTELEAGKLSLSEEGGIQAYAKRISQEQDVNKIIELFQKVMDAAYGVISLDGRKFEKSDEILADFKATQAYSDIYMEFVNDVDKAVEFFSNIYQPKDEGPQDHKKPTAKVTPIENK